MQRTFRIAIIGIIVVGLIAIIPQCYKRIPAGYAGIRENLYGSERGVDDVTEVSGMVWCGINMASSINAFMVLRT